MTIVSRLMTLVSAVALIAIVWLHVEAYGVTAGQFPAWKRIAWGWAVPWFFASAAFWMAVKWRGFGAEIGRRVRSLVIPYFCWGLLGAAWSVALHGVQLEGWDLLRYFGLHPWKDPAYQPMWFIRDLFLLLLLEAGVLSVIKWQGVRSFAAKPPRWVAWIFPVYVLHSLVLSIFRLATGLPRFEGLSALLAVILSVVVSVVITLCLHRFLPCASNVIFGGRGSC